MSVTLIEGGTLRIQAIKDGEPLSTFTAFVKHVDPEIAQIAGGQYFATRGGEIIARNVYPGEIEITASIIEENTPGPASPIGRALAIVAEGQETLVVVDEVPAGQQTAPYLESKME